jgi:hypothetical protein
MHREVLGGAGQRVADRGGITHADCQGAQDAEVLPLGQAKSEVGTGQLGGGALQEVDAPFETDERGELIESGWIEAGVVEKLLRVSTQIRHQVAVATQGLSPHHRRHTDLRTPLPDTESVPSLACGSRRISAHWIAEVAENRPSGSPPAACDSASAATRTRAPRFGCHLARGVAR